MSKKYLLISSLTAIGITAYTQTVQNTSTDSKQVMTEFRNELTIPSRLYMLSDTRNDIFYEPIIKRWRPYEWFVRIESEKEIKFGRKLERVASIDTPVDNGILYFDLYNGDNFSRTRKEVKICIGKKSEGNDKVTVQIIGDSFTHGAFFKDALLDKGYVPGIKMVGLRTVKGFTDQYDEGRGGWTLNNYFDVSVDPSFAYNGFMQPKGKCRYWGSTAFWKNCFLTREKKISDFWATYNCERFENRLSRFDASSGMLLSPAPGDVMYDNDNKTFTEYNGKRWIKKNKSDYTWSFDYGKYLKMWDIEAPDFLFEMLGLNDFRRNPNADYNTFKSQLEIMKESYLKAVPHGKFAILIPASTCGEQDNTEGEFTPYLNAAMWNFRNWLIETYDNKEDQGYYLIDVGITIDNKYGYKDTFEGSDKYTKPYETYAGTEKIRVQQGTPHPYLNYPTMGIPLAAFIQKYRESK